MEASEDASISIGKGTNSCTDIENARAAAQSVQKVLKEKENNSQSIGKQQNLARTDDESWKEWEAVVLSIGAIAKGCITGLYPHLPQGAQGVRPSRMPGGARS
ncbi:uncharacterized protein [Triticum aestivum]|uniref:uncharacterized protein isoform X1 n=1 Tax=Triticum aestivum TaxID=4565 RepID=UPI001D02AC9F|nr:uncharacterized protein LOC123114129 isoform X1 [Triticum aestivum]